MVGGGTNRLEKNPMVSASANDVAELIRALAALAWPLVAIVVVGIFRPELSNMLKRVTRGRAGPIELELARELDELGVRTKAATETLPESAPEAVVGFEHAVSKEILGQASSSPKTALMALSAELDRQAREVLASSRDPEAWQGRSLGQKLLRLELPPQVQSAYDEFRIVRNKIVHGHHASDEDALRALDYGLLILDALYRVPREVHRVLVPRVECYADEDGEQRCEFWAVLLESEQTTDGSRIERAFPTTDTSYMPGQRLSWEWRPREYGEAWYRDSRSGEMRYGWTSSLEFVGRPLEQI
jgi:hypothetical protein